MWSECVETNGAYIVSVMECRIVSVMECRMESVMESVMV